MIHCKVSLVKRCIFWLLLGAGLIHVTDDVYGYGFGYRRTNDHQPPDIGIYEDLFKNESAYYRDITEEKVIYLTFDHGYEKGYTEGILDILNKEKVPACFFVTGHYIRSAPDIMNKIYEAGHHIGNHTYHHYDLTSLTEAKYKDEVKALEKALDLVVPGATMQYLRPPKGIFNEKTLEWTTELGYRHMFWSVAYVDWHEDENPGHLHAYDQVIDQLHPGAVVLMHAVSEDNLLALSDIIKEAKRLGYRFGSLDELVFKAESHHLFW